MLAGGDAVGAVVVRIDAVVLARSRLLVDVIVLELALSGDDADARRSMSDVISRFAVGSGPAKACGKRESQFYHYRKALNQVGQSSSVPDAD